MSCACSRALRPMTSIAWRARAAGSSPPCSIWHPAEDGVQRRAQFVRQRRQELVLEPARLLRRGQPGQLRLLAPRHHHADAAHAHGPPVLVLDAALAFAPPDRAVGRDDAGTRRRAARPRVERALDRREHALAIVGMDLPLVAGERAVERAVRQAVDPRAGSPTTAPRWWSDPSPTCPSTPRRARSAAALRCGGPAARRACARPRTPPGPRSRCASCSSSTVGGVGAA